MITDVAADASTNGSNTPGDTEDDFFSSWDKPSIKRPSNPPSRTGTPPVVSRTGSPFLNAGANGPRSKSPLSDKERESSSPAPTAVRSATAVKKASTGPAAKKSSVLGAKKAPKLGAKKVGGAEVIDFDEAEKKAKEEAERIEKLGYDPEAEQAEADAKAKTTNTGATTIASPTPISPSASSFGSTSKPKERSSGDVERLGMGIGRLGFGQTAKAPTPKKPTFGAVAPTRSAEDGKQSLLFPLSSANTMWIVLTMVSLQKRKYHRTRTDSASRRVSLRTNSSGVTVSTPMHSLKPRSVCASLTVLLPSLATAISAGPKRTSRQLTMGMEI